MNARHERIVAFLGGRGEASVQDLAEHFDVSLMTIRRDLALLERAGRLTRTHGGAVLSKPGVVEFAFVEKGERFAAEKRAIAREAARLVQPGMSVALDSGTTTLEVAKAIRSIDGITVLTSSLAIASVLYAQDNVELVLLGGTAGRGVRSHGMAYGREPQAVQGGPRHRRGGRRDARRRVHQGGRFDARVPGGYGRRPTNHPRPSTTASWGRPPSPRFTTLNRIDHPDHGCGGSESHAEMALKGRQQHHLREGLTALFREVALPMKSPNAGLRILVHASTLPESYPSHPAADCEDVGVAVGHWAEDKFIVALCKHVGRGWPVPALLICWMRWERPEASGNLRGPAHVERQRRGHTHNNLRAGPTEAQPFRMRGYEHGIRRQRTRERQHTGRTVLNTSVIRR